MTDALDAVSTRLKKIEEGIAGITKAYAFDELPPELPSAILPCFVNIPGEATYHSAAEARELFGTYVATEERDYNATLWYAPLLDGGELSLHAAGLQALMERVKAAFLGRPQLGGLQYVLRARLVSDSGPMVAEYIEGSGTQYSECDFLIRVAYIVKVSYEDGD